MFIDVNSDYYSVIMNNVKNLFAKDLFQVDCNGFDLAYWDNPDDYSRYIELTGSKI